MAKCKLCKKSISDGTEYCSDCLDKKHNLTDESYLDSLLNSVKNNTEPVNYNYKKAQNTKSEEPVEKKHKAGAKDKNKYNGQIDPEDLVDFVDFDMHKDLEDMIHISDEELFGHDFEDASSLYNPDDTEDVKKTDNNYISSELELLQEELMTNEQLPYEPELPEEELAEESEEPEEVDEPAEEAEEFTEVSDELLQQEPYEPSGDFLSEETSDTSIQDNVDNIDHDFMEQFMNLDSEEQEDSEEGMVDSLGDLLSSLDIPGLGEETPMDTSLEAEEVPVQLPSEKIIYDEDDLLSLLNQFGMDDSIGADVQAISDLLNAPEKKPKSEASQPSDVGEVFFDALKAVSGLDDLDIDLPEGSEPKLKGSKQKKKKKTSKTSKKKAKVLKGKGLLGKVFGNVVDEKAIREAKKASAEAAASQEGKKKKDKKSKKKGSEDIAESIEERPKGLRQSEENSEEPKSKKEKGAKKEKVKKPKKEKKDVIELIDDYDEIEGRINKLGASIIFAFFGIMVALLLVGTSLFTYSLSIQNAETYFDRQKYTEAYNEVYGMEFKDEDIELYEKIVTVMFVNKQLNSYNNYYAMKKYPEALDSLLKGLKRYDKYIELATMLGIKSDLDYVRDQIIAELEQEFKLSEEEAAVIINSENQKDYSVAVYDVVLENMKY